MATINFDTSNKNFREILGNGLKYQVPRFQRDYAWTDEQWGDLWQDIEEVITDSNEEHYMGYLVLQRTDEKNFIIIDGQQRLTTITLIIIAGLYYLQELIEKDEHADENKQRFGYYPASVHADSLYRTRENRRYCQKLGIRLSGKPLGRPKKRTAENAAELKVQRQLEYQDEIDRIAIEGKFGNCKRKGTLGRIMAKLNDTSESVIHVAIAVLKLNKWLAELLLYLFMSWKELGCFLSRQVVSNLNRCSVQNLYGSQI